MSRNHSATCGSYSEYLRQVTNNSRLCHTYSGFASSIIALDQRREIMIACVGLGEGQFVCGAHKATVWNTLSGLAVAR